MTKLVVGVNDLQSLMPNLAKEWHPTKNGGLKPSDFTLGSTVKVWWRCSKYPEHEWIATIGSRALNGNGCPICSGQKVLKGFNDLETLNPSIAKEWHPTKNGDLKPSDVTLHSGKKVFWICDKNHVWEASVYDRVKGKGCPICAGKKVLKGFNDFPTYYPEIAKEWNYERNGDLTPDMFSIGCNKKFWWRCSKHPEHEWEASINSRIHMNSDCPICSGKQVLKGFNDLETLNPSIAKEWHPTKNGDLKPSDVTLYSNKKVWWMCSNNPNHEWESIVSNRTNVNSGCPICAKEREVSFPEKILAFYLHKVLPIKENVFIGKWNVDILAGNVVIEYDGEYFHSKSIEKDNLKNKDLESEGYVVIRILGRYESSYIKKSDFRYEIQESNHEHFKMVIKDLCNYLRMDYPDVDVKRDEKEIRKLMDGY